MQQPHDYRPDHDQAIRIENRIREEQGFDTFRGLYKFEKHGESYSKDK
jgi:hypothetical protein